MGGCAFHVPGMDTMLRRRAWADVLARQGVLARHGYNAEMTLVVACVVPCARHGYNAETTRVDGCFYHEAGMDTMLR